MYTLIISLFAVLPLVAETVETVKPTHEEIICTLSSLICPECWETDVKSYSDEGYVNTRLESRETSPFFVLLECETWDQKVAKEHACSSSEEYVKGFLDDISFAIQLFGGNTLEKFDYSYKFSTDTAALVHLSIAWRSGEEKFRSETYFLVEIGEQFGRAVAIDFDMIEEEAFEELCSPEFQEKCISALKVFPLAPPPQSQTGTDRSP